MTEHYNMCCVDFFLHPSFAFLLWMQRLGIYIPSTEFNRIYISSNRTAVFLPTEEASSSAHSKGDCSQIMRHGFSVSPISTSRLWPRTGSNAAALVETVIVPLTPHLSITSSPAFTSVKSLWPFLKLSHITEVNTRAHMRARTHTHTEKHTLYRISYRWSGEHISRCRNSTFDWRTHF